jgi:hypothetical protein
MDTRRERFVPATLSDRNIVRDLFADRSGKYWVSFVNTLVSLVSGEKPKEYSDPKLYSMTGNNRGEVFGAGPTGVWQIDSGSLIQVLVSEEKSYAVHAIGNDSLLVAGDNAVKLIVRAKNSWGRGTR